MCIYGDDYDDDYCDEGMECRRDHRHRRRSDKCGKCIWQHVLYLGIIGGAYYAYNYYTSSSNNNNNKCNQNNWNNNNNNCNMVRCRQRRGSSS